MRELSLHILDIVTNSLEAGADRIILFIEELASVNRFRIVVHDNGRGMSQEAAQQVLDPFVTSRSTRTVGLGLPLLKMAAEQSGGYLVIKSTVGKGTRVTADFKKNSLNRAPLGDIAETVMNLIIGTPEIHLCYIHKTDKGVFIFDSYWILARMAEQNITLYELTKPVKERILSGLQKINSVG
ncbi:ATP-binding protein [candidate division KSB1 bacterium]|nr:ATP-binding protein [candidate division KSB1 bacterium]